MWDSNKLQKQDSNLMGFLNIFRIQKYFHHSELKLHKKQLVMCAIAWGHAEKCNWIKKH